MWRDDQYWILLIFSGTTSYVIYGRKFSAIQRRRNAINWRQLRFNELLWPKRSTSSGFVDEHHTGNEMSIGKSTPISETIENLLRKYVYEMLARFFLCCCSLVRSLFGFVSVADGKLRHAWTHTPSERALRVAWASFIFGVFRRTDESFQIIESHLSFVCQTPNK